MAGRLLKGRTTQLRVTHEALSIATIAAIVLHAGALLGDGFLHPSLADITIPFVSGFKPLWTSTGHRRGLDARAARRLLLRARPDRAGALAPDAPLHRARVGARGHARAVRGDGRRRRAWFLATAAAVVLPATALLAVRMAASTTDAGRAAAMTAEAVQRFGCFGGTCEVRVGGRRRLGRQPRHAARRGCSSGTGASRASTPAASSPGSTPTSAPSSRSATTMAALAAAVVAAGERTGGLVTGRCCARSRRRATGPPPRRRCRSRCCCGSRRGERRAGPSPAAGAGAASTRGGAPLRRPATSRSTAAGSPRACSPTCWPSGSAAARAFVIDCAGDLRLGGSASRGRCASRTRSAGRPAHVRAQRRRRRDQRIGRHSWLGRDGRPGHHLLDASTGRPAFTGVVQATALAPTRWEAEFRAKAAIWAAPRGGDDGSRTAAWSCSTTGASGGQRARCRAITTRWISFVPS